jgi:hypothetical protein
MRFIPASSAAFLLTLASLSVASAQEVSREGVANKIKADFSKAIPGLWVNEGQTFFGPETGMTEAELPPRQEVQIRVEGDTVSVGKSDGTRTYTLAVDPALPGARLTPVQADTCGYAIKSLAGGFEARTEADCPADKAGRLVVEGDRMVMEGASGPAVDMRRARGFVCWTAVMRGASHGDNTRGMTDWQFSRDGWLHDQGGELALMTDETPPREFYLKLRRVEWPYGDRRASLTLYVHEKGDTRAVSYVWTDADYERIGINLRWLQASCTFEPTRVFE